MRRTFQASSEKGASRWLSTLLIAEHGFALHKEAFRDALCLRYGWRPAGLPTTCVCGKNFSVEHALNCPCGGLPSMRHNELQNITAQCLTEVCHGVGIEPHLQPLSDEPLDLQQLALVMFFLPSTSANTLLALGMVTLGNLHWWP